MATVELAFKHSFVLCPKPPFCWSQSTKGWIANEIDDGVRKVSNQWRINFVIFLHFGSRIWMHSLVHIVQYVLRDYSSARNLYALPALDTRCWEKRDWTFQASIWYKLSNVSMVTSSAELFHFHVQYSWLIFKATFLSLELLNGLWNNSGCSDSTTLQPKQVCGVRATPQSSGGPIMKDKWEIFSADLSLPSAGWTLNQMSGSVSLERIVRRAFKGERRD